MSSGDMHAIVADTVFDGTKRHENAGVLVDGSRIGCILPRNEIPPSMAVRVLPDGAWLAPGFIDLQVNGGGDVLFNEAPTAAGIRAIAAAHRRFGTTSLLPTFITDSTNKMKAAWDAVQQLADVEPGVIGIHFEGPFLSPEKPGVHS